MKKDKVVFMVSEDGDFYDFEDGENLAVSAWKKDNHDIMIDEHVTELYPELESELELEELADGQMIYYGELTKSELEDEIRSYGFTVIKNNKHFTK